MQGSFDAVVRAALGAQPPRRIGLSVSGGVDSMALASLAAGWARPRGIGLHAFVVDHGLREGSTAEATRVAGHLWALGVHPQVLTLDLAGGTASTMELRARKGRRQLIARECARLDVPLVMQGHTLNDQHELFLLRLLKSSGWYGLGGMHLLSYMSTLVPPGAEPIRLLKPLLGICKADLRTWCLDNSVPWFEDSTNQDPTLTKRNALRKLLTDYSSVLPPALQFQSLSNIVSLYAEERAAVTGTAKTVFGMLLASASTKFDNELGTATFDMPSDFQALSARVRAAVVYEILGHLSPLPANTLAYKRSAVLTFVENGYHVLGSTHDGKRQGVLLDVLVKKDAQVLTFQRAPPRRDQIPDLHTKATSVWSQWSLFDNRYWFRWKLSDPTGSPKLLTVRLCGSLSSKTLCEIFARPLPTHELLSTQPLFVWGHLSDSIEPDQIVGIPTLGITRGIDVEFHYKQLLP